MQVHQRYASTIATPDRRAPVFRHESWDELERRSRSPASNKPKFPLFRLPKELREEIFSYLLPRVHEGRDPARKPRPTRLPSSRPFLPRSASSYTSGISNVVWQRGDINLLCVCKQLHDECAELVYGRNTFLLFVTFAGINFRFRWLLPSGLATSRSVPFVELIPAKYLALIRKAVVQIDHVDSYTGMIKFNVSGKGLTHGLRRQVQKLVNVLKPAPNQTQKDDKENAGLERRLIRLTVRVANGNAVMDQIKHDISRHRENDSPSNKTYKGVSRITASSDGRRTGSERISDDIEDMLSPFGQLRGVRDISIGGAVPDDFAMGLEQVMRSTAPVEYDPHMDLIDSPAEASKPPPLRVYGNDID